VHVGVPCCGRSVPGPNVRNTIAKALPGGLAAKASSSLPGARRNAVAVATMLVDGITESATIPTSKDRTTADRANLDIALLNTTFLGSMDHAETEAGPRFLGFGEGSRERHGKECRDGDRGAAFQSGSTENVKRENRCVLAAALSRQFGSITWVAETGQPGLEPGIAGFGDQEFSEKRRSGEPNSPPRSSKGKTKGKNRRRNFS
jgi:hypothetical protein